MEHFSGIECFSASKIIISDSKEEMVTIMTFSFFKWYFLIFHVFIILFLYLNFSQDLLTLVPIQLSVPFLSKKNQTKPKAKKKKKTQKKIANKSEWQKNTKTKQHKRTEPWNLAMLLSYTWARWLNKANAHMKPETWQHAQGPHQLRTDSWREAGTSSAFECVTPSGALSLPL